MIVIGRVITGVSSGCDFDIVIVVCVGVGVGRGHRRADCPVLADSVAKVVG